MVSHSEQDQYVIWAAQNKRQALEAYLELVEAGEVPGGFEEWNHKRLQAIVQGQLEMSGGYETSAIKNMQRSIGERPLPKN